MLHDGGNKNFLEDDAAGGGSEEEFLAMDVEARDALLNLDGTPAREVDSTRGWSGEGRDIHDCSQGPTSVKCDTSLIMKEYAFMNPLAPPLARAHPTLMAWGGLTGHHTRPTLERLCKLRCALQDPF